MADRTLHALGEYVAQALPQDREKCLARGFNAYLAKPFSYKELGDLLGAMFSRNSD